MDAGALAPVGGGKYNHDLPSSGSNEHADILFDYAGKYIAKRPHDTRADTVHFQPLLAGATPYPWPNNGDYGMNLPMNLLCWGVMSMLSLLVWLFLRTATVRITRTSILMLASAVLFTLPILWSPSEGLPTALPRLVGIWGGVMCYVTLLQVPLQEKETTGFLSAGYRCRCGMSDFAGGALLPGVSPLPAQ
jgi:hypothetical protein